MATAFLLGGTGMVGTQILHLLRSTPSFKTIDLIARRNPPPPLTPSEPDTKTNSYIEPDTAKWPAHFQSLSPSPEIYFCAFATTRAAAGGFDNQYKIEHDLNLELARAAKASGTKIFVLISSNGANAASRMAYIRMKGEMEEHIKELGFDTTIFIRPGLITGTREESRPAEAVVRKIASFAGTINRGLKDFWAQDADVIAGAAVAASVRAVEGNGVPPEGVKEETNDKGAGKVWILGQADIVRVEQAWVKESKTAAAS